MGTYYISPSGNDTTGTGTLASPWLTLNKANTASADGDTVILLNGTYTWTAANYSFNYARTYTGQSTAGVILDGGGAYVNTNLGVAEKATVVQNITFQNAVACAAGAGNGKAIFAVNTGTVGTVLIKNCIFAGTLYSQGYDYFNGGIIGGDGTYKSRNITLQNCLFNDIKKVSSYDTGGNQAGIIDSMNTTSYIQSITVQNCTFIFNATGVNKLTHVFGFGTLDNGTASLILKNNIFYNNTGGSLNLIGGTISTLTKASTTNDYSGTYTNKPSGTGDITSDPLFVDAANGNYNLRPSSPCIDTGTL